MLSKLQGKLHLLPFHWKLMCQHFRANTRFPLSAYHPEVSKGERFLTSRVQSFNRSRSVIKLWCLGMINWHTCIVTKYLIGLQSCGYTASWTLTSMVWIIIICCRNFDLVSKFRTRWEHVVIFPMSLSEEPATLVTAKEAHRVPPIPPPPTRNCSLLQNLLSLVNQRCIHFLNLAPCDISRLCTYRFSRKLLVRHLRVTWKLKQT